MTIAIIYGSVRTDRQGIKAALFIQKKLQDRGHEAILIDPMEAKLPLLDKMHKEFDVASKSMESIHQTLKNAEGFVIVSGEYNHAPPPALLNLLDHFQREYLFKPSAIVSYSVGGFGGVRAAMVLRQFLPELGMSSIPSIFSVSKVHEFKEDGTPSSDRYNQSVIRFLDEFEWYVSALTTARDKKTPY